MKAFNSAQKAVAAVFVLSLFVYLYLNLTVRRFDIYYGLSLIAPSASVSEYASKTLEIDSILRNYAFRRESLLDFYSYIQVRLGKEENGNFDLVRSKDGSLNYGDFYHNIPQDLEEYALRVRRLKDYANGAGCELLFLNAPPINVDGYHTYSPGLHYQDQNIFMDAMLFFLQGLDVDYLDMRTALRDSGLELSKYRYKTDVHWTIEASFEGFRALVRTLENEYGESIDPEGFFTDADNYSRSTYIDGFVGSLGERAGAPFSGRDDFTMLLPDFPTSLSIERNDSGEITLVEGDFAAALIDDDYRLSGDLYMSYLGGLAPFRHIVNNYNEDGLRILFLSDSFSLPLAAFLSPAVSEVDMIYTASQAVFGYSIDIDGHIEQNAADYDYIIVQLSPGSYNETGFSFFAD